MLALLFAAAPLVQTDPDLFVFGKPTLGGTLRAEVAGASGDVLLLGLDVDPGPVQFGSVTIDLGLTPALNLFSLGTATAQPAALQGALSTNPSLAGLALYFQAAAIDSGGNLSVSQPTSVQLAAPLPLGQVDDFTYQLQGPGGVDLQLAPIAASAFDLCVIDFSRDGVSEFGASEIASLKGGGDADRIRLAYMSIGEAEDYRWYWNSISPSLVAASNPLWPGNFKVLFWEPEWKEVVLTGNAAVGKSYLDRVIDAGFDGVYLDIIDAFEFFGPLEAGGQDARRNAAAEMVQFVIELSHHARVVRGRSDFLVFPQNGANLFENEWYPVDTLGPADPTTPQAMAALQRQRYFTAIDGIGCEDLFFSGPADENNPYAPDNYLLGILAGWVADGVKVLSIDYVTQTPKIDALYGTHAPNEGFVPYATVRDLDLLTINPGHAPD